MRVVVTGAAGFIGANIVHALNQRGVTDIIAVDHLANGDKFRNLADLEIADYVDRNDFYGRFATGHFGKVEAVFHEGACSDTMQNDGQYMMRLNYECSRDLFIACQSLGVRLLYASSAATYGGSPEFRVDPSCERPLNVYGYSKLLFDRYLRSRIGPDFSGASLQVAGFRYFNVYGLREQHKARMASVAYHQHHQYRDTGRVRLFGSYGGYGPGEQRRDFIWVDDLVAVKMWFFDHPDRCGLFNLGTGRAQAFNDIALAVINAWRHHRAESAVTLAQAQAQSLIEYTDFPAALVGKYQCYTQADMSGLRSAGCNHAFASVEQGVQTYIAQLISLEQSEL